MAPLLDERAQRLRAAAESVAIGYGGDALVLAATGLARQAIAFDSWKGFWDATFHHCGGNAGRFTRTLTRRPAAPRKAGCTPRSFDRQCSARRTRPAREPAWRHAAP